MKPETQETLMRRYLLGELPEAESSALEESLLSDDGRFELMWEAENDLIDGYVRGRLAEDVRERFERHYLASPVHRRRVAAARVFIAAADGRSAEPATSAPQVRWRVRLSEIFALPAPWRLAQAAALLLLAAACLWLLLDRARLRREAAQLKAAMEAREGRERALADQLAAARDRGPDAAAEREGPRRERDALAPEPAGPQATRTPAAVPPPAARREARPPRVLSFLLSPTLVRSGGGPQALDIPRGTDYVRLRVPAPEEDAGRFLASVRTVEGRQIWEQRATSPRRGARSALITVQVPADRLAAGDYILTLSDASAAGEPAEVNRYFFRVDRR